MKRRQFIAGLGSAAAWPAMARAQQQPERMRRIGMLWAYAETDPDGKSRMAALREGLLKFGWIEGRNLRFDHRWGASNLDADLISKAAELVALAPDVIVPQTGTQVRAWQRLTHTVPIVFPGVNDPV